MKTDYYIVQSGTLRREGNTIYFENEAERRILPVNKISSIYAYGQLTMSSGVIHYLCKSGIPVHFFNYYGYYDGTMYPKEQLLSGDLTIRQAEYYLDPEKRLFLAKAFIEGATKNILRNLEYYARENPVISPKVKDIENTLANLDAQNTIFEIMQIEGACRQMYYQALDEILPEDYRIETRTRQPPENKMNTLISFGNSMVYATTVSQIYCTQLNPTVSYLHEPSERRFSLSLDVSEIFKPILADRVILKLVNKKMLDDTHFEGEIGNMLLSEKGRRLYLKEYDEKLKTTIKHKGLGREVSYKRMILLELYKLVKHLLGEKKYSPLVMWW